mgnify:CR=1 FL=1
MNFHVLSDIHLEFYKEYPGFHHFINTSADYLFLAGDIGDPFSENYAKFLEECSQQSYKYIFIIAGNHEYYNHHFHKVAHKIKTLCSPKIIFLQNSSFDLEDITIIGTTLWSQMTYPELSDYRKIKNWTIERNNRENQKALNYLKKTIDSGKKYIIMTHHVPVLFGNHEGFYNDYEDFITQRENILAWIYGHDHLSTDIKIKNTRILSNQYGYPDENANYIDKVFTL